MNVGVITKDVLLPHVFEVQELLQLVDLQGLNPALENISKAWQALWLLFQASSVCTEGEISSVLGKPLNILERDLESILLGIFDDSLDLNDLLIVQSILELLEFSLALE